MVNLAFNHITGWMKKAIIIEGSGYIGGFLLRGLLSSDKFDSFVIYDINLKKFWIFNFAATHREPEHDYKGCFDTNITGVKNSLAPLNEMTKIVKDEFDNEKTNYILQHC